MRGEGKGAMRVVGVRPVGRGRGLTALSREAEDAGTWRFLESVKMGILTYLGA